MFTRIGVSKHRSEYNIVIVGSDGISVKSFHVLRETFINIYLKLMVGGSQQSITDCDADSGKFILCIRTSIVKMKRI